MKRLLKAFLPPLVIILPAEIIVAGAIWDYAQTATGDPSLAIVILGGAWLVGPSLFFLPTIVAGLRDAPNYWGILTTNVLGSLVIGIGWLAALIWAFIDKRPQPIVVQQHFYRSQSPPNP